MGGYSIYVALAVAALLIAGALHLYRRRNNGPRQAACYQTAMESFDAQRAPLAAKFLPAAAASGKPRGLRWTSCELNGPAVFAIDDSSRTLYALVAATISFEAVEGGGMEDVEAVGNLRSATAVFLHRGEWRTDGRVIFNLEPREALGRFQSTLRPVAQ